MKNGKARPKKIAPPRCPVHHLTGVQSFSAEEAEFLLAKAAELNLCDSCRETFREICRSLPARQAEVPQAESEARP